MEALIRQHTAVIDGRLLNFRRYHRPDNPEQTNFSTTRIWVRVQGLPLSYLTVDWARQIFEQLGYVEDLDHDGGVLPFNSELRARILIDSSLPLIPGCYIPLEGERVMWVYFRYEGIFKFCKQCGCAGHSTIRCNVDIQVANRRIRARLQGEEENRMRVLYGPVNYPVYTNNIEGKPDRYRNRNPEVDLIRFEEPEDLPLHQRFQGEGFSEE